jgi:predicted dithiol-disulfide oxidoreductase (DUF899 family)
MSIPTEVVSKAEWDVAREALLAKEKKLTRARDALAAERRRLPMVRVEKEYRFEGADGEASLLELFEGRRQLHLNARDTTFAFVSGGSQEAIRNYRGRMGWAEWPWYTTADDFSADFDVDQWFGINVFLRDGDTICRSYYTTSRGAEELSSIWALLDITPFGRQETWQDAPAGVPQDRTGSWVRRSDEYTPEELAGGRT